MTIKNISELKKSIITTRYRGSKTKVIPSIWNATQSLNFFTVLDCFGGTGAVSYLFKRMDKAVTYNDHLKFNAVIGRALIENDNVLLSNLDLEKILHKKDYNTFPHVIEKNFKDIYYLDEENIWLDRVISNIYEMDSGYKKDMAFWCLFQSCIIKRPFSLFHRKNLNLRLRDVKRSFGNKTTWETPFDIHYRKFAKELNDYIYDSNGKCSVLQSDTLKIDLNKRTYDLVYIDPPYIPSEGENIIYRDLYHFLEGITNYNSWEHSIDFNSKHKRLIPEYNLWNDKKRVIEGFSNLVEKFKDSIILISHRSDGLPSKEEIIQILKKYKDNVTVVDTLDHKYALSLRNSKEILILGQ